jgi:hypothetical protein
MNKFLFLISTFLLLIQCDNNEALVNTSSLQLQSGADSFIYNQYQPFSHKPIEVFYYIPEGADNSLPILISLHGANRNGNDHRDSFITKANQLKFIVIVPQFGEDYFPGGDAYNLANIFIDGDNPSSSTLNPEDQWTFSVIDPLFNYIRSVTSNTSNQYNLIGFSAGGQLAHRTFLFSNSIYCNKTIAMSSGWYTTINENIDFPYGINESPLLASSIPSLLAKELIILVGENDNDPNAPLLRRNSLVDQQGTNRLDRAEHFFSTANTIAINEGHTFNWNKFIIPNAAHDLSPIASFAVNLLYL